MALQARSTNAGIARLLEHFMTLATDQNSEGLGLSPTGVQFIAIRDAVMDRWEREVRARVEGADNLLRPVLTNTLPAFFDNIGEALSAGHPREQGASGNNAASAHGSERARMTPFGPDQVIQEYQIFRESIAAVAETRVQLTSAHWAIIDRSINEATREAIRSFTGNHEELRRKVAAAVSHDMRTPISVIVNAAQIISMTPDPAVARGMASKIEANARRLETMMEELLDALTYQGGAKMPLHLTRFDILNLVTEVRDQYADNGEQVATFEASCDSVIGFWCRASMRRALENLINNAIKYGNGGLVKIQARETRGRLMLTVHNEGNPIPEEQRNRIFEYLRREGGAPDAAGWGIGLPFVKAIAESHGGSVTVDSSPETGTTFLIDVPVDCRPFVDNVPAGLL